MKTLIVADFHLGTENADDQPQIALRLRQVIEATRPDRIVFNGDTFELILPIATDTSQPDKTAVLKNICSAWQEIFDYLRRSDVPKFVFLAGEHDHEITRHDLEQVLQETLVGHDVKTDSQLYDQPSRSLVMHGHQLDYNRIFEDAPGKRVSCVDGLTRAINRFLTEAKMAKRLKEAMKRQDYSPWYAFSRLPEYVEATRVVFGADKELYEKEISDVLRENEFETWLKYHSSLTTRCIGKGARIVAKSPKLLLALYKPFYTLLGRIVDQRIRRIVEGKPYADVIPSWFSNPVDNVVLGHFHRPEQREYRQGKRMYNVSSPRVHVEGIRDGALHLFRDHSYAVIDDEQVALHNQRYERGIPVAELKAIRG